MKVQSYKALALSMFLAASVVCPTTCFLLGSCNNVSHKSKCSWRQRHEQSLAFKMPIVKRPSRLLLASSTTEDMEVQAEAGAPALKSYQRGEDGIWQLTTKEEHAEFLAEHPKELVVMKFFAPWCRACKALEPKYKQVAADERYKTLPVVFAQLDVSHNKEFIKSLGILALPCMQFYAGPLGLVENFPCGPSKVPILKRKLAEFVNANVDPNTRELHFKKVSNNDVEASPEKQVKLIGEMVLTPEQLKVLREIPYFADFTDEEFDDLLSKATLQTFDAGNLIMRQGMEGNMFYVIDSGEVEIFQKSGYEDPMTTPSNYLGTQINTLTTNNYFGERALITREPRAASIRTSKPTRCFAFHKDNIPSSSVLSGKKEATEERLRQLDVKYGVDAALFDDVMTSQMKTISVANQNRGSVNTPRPILGVDVEEEEAAYIPGKQEENITGKQDVLSLLVRFRLIRQAARCFEHIVRTQPRWGDPGETRRRSILVSKLTPAQQEEFRDVFKMIDVTRDGNISVLELKQVMESIGSEKTEEELYDMINKANPAVDGNTEITLDKFMGVMAEAEFYYLFTDTFNALDKYNSGFVRAADLDRVLCGMRDLISDDRMSIIDVEDKEMLVDYEQFSKMLLGASL